MPEDNAPKYKMGRMSHAEQTWIRENVRTIGIDEVSRKLNRSVETIDNFCRSEGIVYEDDPGDKKSAIKAEEAALAKELKKTPEWEALKEEFTDKELEYFQHRYGKMMAQFQEDVLSSEETQIFHQIKFEILMQRNLKGCKRAQIDIRRLEKEMSQMIIKYENEDMPKDARDLLMALENQLLSLRSAMNSKSTEYVKLQEKHSAILKELKATRDQRITKFQDSDKNIMSLLKEMQTAKFRNEEGRQQALVNLAVKKEEERLTGYHTYEDGTVDQPILSSETLKDD